MSVSSDSSSTSLASSDNAEAPSQEAPPAEVPSEASQQAAQSALPVPIGPLRSQLTSPREEQTRPSFWRRIKMRRRDPEATGAGSEAAVSARLSAMERAIEQFDSNLQAQLEALNGRLDEVWESEEQLSQLADIQEKLNQLTELQSSLSQSLAGLKRTLGWLGAWVAAAAVGAGFALQLVL